MLAVDTNVVVRFLANDDPVHSPRARALLENEIAFVCTTVILEAEWVLRGLFERDRNRVIKALRAFIALPNVVLEHPDRVRAALDAVRPGFEFADALHYGASARCEAFATFDGDFREAIRELGGQAREP